MGGVSADGGGLRRRIRVDAAAGSFPSELGAEIRRDVVPGRLPLLVRHVVVDAGDFEEQEHKVTN